MQSIICRTTAVAALLAVLPASPAAAQALPDPPSADRQPLSLSEPRVAPLPEAQWTSEHYRLVGRFRGDGRADNQLHTLLNVPATAEGLLPLAAYLTERSTLSPRQRSLLILRAAWLGGSQPLWATGAARARDGGLTDSDLRRIAEGPEASGWDPFERTLLQLADQLYRNSSVTDAVWDALAERFSQHNMIDAVETVNHFVVLSMIYNALGVQPDDDTPDRLPADVPYRIAVPEREPPLAAARLEPPGRPGHRGVADLRPACRAGRGPQPARGLHKPRITADAARPGDPDPAHRVGLPGSLRVGQARRHGRPRALPRGGPAGSGSRSACAGRGRLRSDADAGRRRAVRDRERLR